jgi:hypothetical protein
MSDRFQFRLPIYNVVIKVLKDNRNNITDLFNQATGLDKKVTLYPMELAKTIQVSSEKEGSYIVILLTELTNTPIIVHEAVHTTKAAMRIAGIKQPDEETEAFITQYCFSVIDSYLKPD